MAFITDAELKTRLAAVLKVAEAAVPAYWNSIITDANEAAYQDIVSALVNRGFTLTQITAWDRAAEFNRDIGLFWALVKGAGLHGYDDKFIKLLDRRPELLDLLITTSGVAVDTSATGEIGHGALDGTNDLFKLTNTVPIPTNAIPSPIQRDW